MNQAIGKIEWGNIAFPLGQQRETATHPIAIPSTNHGTKGHI